MAGRTTRPPRLGIERSRRRSRRRDPFGARSNDYLASLRDRGVSYLLAGTREADLSLALEKIAARFGVGTLMLEGGGKINGAFLREGLVDEVSVLVAPIADGRIGTPALFDVEGTRFAAQRLVLESVERRSSGVVWLRYAVQP